MIATRFDAIFSAHYGRRFATVTSRFWGRVALVLTSLEILSGSVAFAAWLKQSVEAAALAGIVIAVIAVLNQLLSPKEKSIREDIIKKQFGSIIKESPNLSDDALIRRVIELQNEPNSEIEALRDPVYIQTADELGLKHSVPPLTNWQKIMSAVA